MASPCIILTTAGSKREGEKIARALVGRKLAACVNCVPAASIFRWQRKIERASEVLLVIKSTRAAFAEVAAAIRELHSYELPECIQLAITAGPEAYMNWISENVAIPKRATKSKARKKRKA